MSSDDISVVLSDDRPPVDTLAVGVSEYGLAGLTAVDYLADQHSMREVGHLRTSEPPFSTPFENGTPRHHTRRYVDEASSFAVLLGTAVRAAGSGRIARWRNCDRGEKTGGFRHYDAHRRPHRTRPGRPRPVLHCNADVSGIVSQRHRHQTIGNGFLDGLSAELVTRGIDESLPTGVFTTPTHPQAPDAAAAIRLLTALKECHS
ncbi:proteasome assembly chaperone family protein [Halogeometricum sp. wsp3]|nr:proteasome assembly chaperone family protein [Halogeometricum sp. wsp3]